MTSDIFDVHRRAQETLKDYFTNSIGALPILEGVFLGHVVLVARIVVNLAKVEAVLRWK